MRGETCKIPGCGRGVYAKGLCLVHYQRWWQNAPQLRQVALCDSTCSLCNARHADIPPSRWKLDGDQIICPTCALKVEDPATDPRFTQFWAVLLEMTGVGKHAYLNPDSSVLDFDEPDDVEYVAP